MDKRTYLNNLYDYYQSLLTENERNCFLDYYENDYSLSEIAESNSVSRSAIHKTLKNVITKLEYFEENLKMYSRKQKVLQKLSNFLNPEELENIKNILS